MSAKILFANLSLYLQAEAGWVHCTQLYAIYIAVLHEGGMGIQPPPSTPDKKNYSP